jgi:hypothetical protein
MWPVEHKGRVEVLFPTLSQSEATFRLSIPAFLQRGMVGTETIYFASKKRNL